jgi:signal transduction histidine kinase
LTPQSARRSVAADGMNPLPRFLGLSLFVVLAVLTALLAAPALTAPGPDAPPRAATSAPAADLSTRSALLASLPRRFTLPLAITSLVLAAALLISLTLRPALPGGSRPSFSAARAEIGALSRLAKSSVAQGEALDHERGVRQRAEADALLNQQRLTQSLEEKIRLGRDLHDGIIQSLYATGLTIESARALAREDPPEADRRLAQCQQSLNATIREVRTYIGGLTPEHVRHAGFTQAVRALAAELGASRPVHFDLNLDEEAVALLTPEQTTETLQIVREAVSNSLRHGGATALTLRLHRDERAVCLLVQDNGRGFDAARAAHTGHGLGNMQARAGRLGATVRLESSPGAGARVILTLPVQT